MYPMQHKLAALRGIEWRGRSYRNHEPLFDTLPMKRQASFSSCKIQSQDSNGHGIESKPADCARAGIFISVSESRSERMPWIKNRAHFWWEPNQRKISHEICPLHSSNSEQKNRTGSAQVPPLSALKYVQIRNGRRSNKFWITFMALTHTKYRHRAIPENIMILWDRTIP